MKENQVGALWKNKLKKINELYFAKKNDRTLIGQSKK